MLTLIIATLAVAATAFPTTWQEWSPAGTATSPSYSGGPPPSFSGAPNCLTDAQANALVASYATLLQAPQGPNFNTTADSILTNNFTVYSDSINTLGGTPLGSPVYSSKLAFINSQAHTPPIPVVQTLGVFHSCDQIAWRWNGSSLGSNQYEVKGMIDMDVDVGAQQIKVVYSEFNSGAWLANYGYPECKNSTA